MSTRTSAVKSIYVNTREVISRLAFNPPSENASVFESITRHLLRQDRPIKSDTEYFYRPLTFSTPLSQAIEIPREGLTTLELGCVSIAENVHTFDYYELTEQNLGFIITFQGKIKGRDTEPIHLIMKDFHKEFTFAKNVVVPALRQDGIINWRLEKDPLANDCPVYKMMHFDLESTGDSIIKLPPNENKLNSESEENYDEYTMSELVKLNKNNIIFRINRYLAGFENNPRELVFSASTETRLTKDIILQEILRNKLSKLRLVLADSGAVMLVYNPWDKERNDDNLVYYVSISSGIETVQFYTFRKYFNLRMQHEGDVPIKQRLPVSNENVRSLMTVGRCQKGSIQPKLSSVRNILRIVFWSTASSSNQYFWAQNTYRKVLHSDWTHTAGVIAFDFDKADLIHSEKINLTPGARLDSIQIAVVNEYGDPIWTSNDFMFFFNLANDSSLHNPNL